MRPHDRRTKRCGRERTPRPLEPRARASPAIARHGRLKRSDAVADRARARRRHARRRAGQRRVRSPRIAACAVAERTSRRVDHRGETEGPAAEHRGHTRAGSTSCSSAATPARARAASAADDGGDAQRRHHAPARRAGPEERDRRQHPARHGRAASRLPDETAGTRRAGQPINVTLSYGGLACTVLTVQNLTGLDIQFAGLITFKGVIAMSNAVGGVAGLRQRRRSATRTPGSPSRRPARTRSRATTRSRSCAAGTASATAATWAASARSRCSCRRWCARSRATTPSPTSASCTASRRRRPRTSRCRELRATSTPWSRWRWC